MRLRLDHIGFSLIWEQHYVVLHHSWNSWEIQWRLAPHLVNTCLRKGLCEINTLTLQTYNTLQNQHQPHCGPLYHRIIRVQVFRRHYLLDIPYHIVSCFECTDCLIRFPIALEGPCSWKQIVISNRLPWNNPPCVPYHDTLNFIIHCLELFFQIFA